MPGLHLGVEGVAALLRGPEHTAGLTQLGVNTSDICHTCTPHHMRGAQPECSHLRRPGTGWADRGLDCTRRSSGQCRASGGGGAGDIDTPAHRSQSCIPAPELKGVRVAIETRRTSSTDPDTKQIIPLESLGYLGVGARPATEDLVTVLSRRPENELPARGRAGV